VPGGTETILLVEDDESIRSTVAEVLTDRGYSVIEAADGSAAEGIASEHDDTIHLLLTDVVLPGLSGPELAERLAEARPEIKVLFVSGYTERVALDDGMLQTGRNFIQKPFRPSLVVRKVRELLDAGDEASR
jgi:DNA-binding response OmpR family regulator